MSRRPHAPSGAADRPGGRGKSDQHNAATIGRSGSAHEAVESQLAPGLYVTATPIGNASDITLRALKVLSECDAILAEDTRVTARLLSIHGISRSLLSYNDNNAPRMRPVILKRLGEGQRLALVSDAGTPLISDPGHRLVRAAIAEGYPVYPIPGASAVLSGLSVAGLPTDRFLFAGFPPAKDSEKRRFLASLAGIPATLVFFEAPGRIARTLAAMAEIFGAREAAVLREITKLHEEARRGMLSDLAASYSGAAVKGEITLVVGPPAPVGADAVPDRAKIEELLALALPHMPIAAAASLVAAATTSPRRAVYATALEMKERRNDPDVEGDPQ